MNYHNLMEWVSAEPFAPFRLHLTDGRTIDIEHPNLIWPGKYTAMIGIPEDPNEPEIPARHRTVSLIHIVNVEPLNSAPAAGT